MDEFNYLAVLISIILGLGITQLLSGFGRWIEHRASFRAYAPTIVWVIVLLLIHVQTWWTMFGMRFHPHWTFLQFSIVLLQPIALYLLAIVLLPSANAAELDLKANYFQQRHWFFGLLIALLVVSISKDLVLKGALPDTPNLVFHAVFLTGSGIALATESNTYHRCFAYFMATIMLAYIALLFATLS
jgi:hypothetical protein